jgi:hypothetical protein
VLDRAGARSSSPARLAVAAIGLLLIAALAPGNALAAPTWLAPENVSAPGYNGEESQVGVDGAGDTFAVWVRFDGSNEIVQAAERPAGGAWGPAVNLSAPGQDAEAPRLAVDAAGDAVAVWKRYDGTDEIVEAASMTAGGSWGAPVPLSAPGEGADSPGVAIDPAGDAVAVWRRYDGTDEIIQASTRPAGGVWQSPVGISEAGENAYRPQVAIDAAGEAVAVWQRTDGVHLIVQAASRAAGGPWGPAVDLSAAGEDSVEAQIAVDPAGDAIAVWESYVAPNEVIQAAERPAGGAWQLPVDLSESTKEASLPAVAIDPAGDAVAVWEVLEGGSYVVQAADLMAGRAWQAPVDLSTPGHDSEEARAAIDPAGNAVAIWAYFDGTHYVVQSSTQNAGSTWQPAVELSAPGEDAFEPEVAVDPDGDAVASWSRSDGTSAIVQAAGYDAAGPQLRSLSIPASGTAGAQLSFSVSPFDIWSGLGATEWSFGDGAGAAGTSVTHTFNAPGTYTVKVTGIDAVGNASTATGTVTIAPVSAASIVGKGIAKAARILKVKGRVALLALSCPSGAGCAGTARLTVTVKATHRATAPRRRRKAKPVAIGKAPFNLAAGGHRTIKVPLTKNGAALLAAAGPKGLKARLLGSGVVGRAVVLKAAGHRRRH